jgi:hypothetical protein
MNPSPCQSLFGIGLNHIELHPNETCSLRVGGRIFSQKGRTKLIKRGLNWNRETKIPELSTHELVQRL